MESQITQLLQAWRAGDRKALDAAMPQLYQMLRKTAVQRLVQAGAAGSVTFDPTDLVHEAMLRLLGPGKVFANRAHFLAVSALCMRGILVDRARDIIAGRHLAGATAITLSGLDGIIDNDKGEMDVVVLDEALRKLEAVDARAAQVMELSWFSGMSREEIAQTIDMTLSTVDRDLRFARAFVQRALE